MRATTGHRGFTRRQMGKVITYALLIAVTVVLTIPVVYLISTSLKSESEYISEQLQFLPRSPQWRNYYLALTMIDFGRYALNSFLLATSFATLTVITSSMAGYGFARIPGVGRSRLFSVVVALILIPASIFIIPQFVLFSNLRVTNSYWPWVLWGLSASPFFIFLFRQFFLSFPAELEEAAEVDGARVWRIFVQIVLPNSYPALATSFILAFLSVWGDWLMPLLYLADKNTTLAVKLITAYVNPQGFPIVTPTLAASVLYILPPVVMFFFVQRYIMQGVVTSGLKG
ncbi:MAG: carbohydrate ABC transporter permease [Caldilineaceae bacterium]|nr:carbohydrate ABC transporter permease [Caldilineaceae bacterium]